MSLILYLLELALLLWIFSFFAELSRRSTCGIGGFNSLYRFLNHHRWLHFCINICERLFSDKEYLKCTAQGFSYKPYPKKDWQFYSWGQVEKFALTKIKGSRNARDFYIIEVQFYDKELLKSNFFWFRLRSRFTSSKHSNVLKIPIYLLDVGLPKRVFETMDLL